MHKKNYVCPEIGARTQPVERQWVEVRAWLRKSRGNRAQLQSYMFEISCRALHRDKNEKFSLYKQLIARIIKVHNVYNTTNNVE